MVVVVPQAVQRISHALFVVLAEAVDRWPARARPCLGCRSVRHGRLGWGTDLIPPRTPKRYWPCGPGTGAARHHETCMPAD